MDAAQLKSFLEDLQTQHGLYREMVALNEAQTPLLESNDPDPDALMTIVGHKQNLMTRIAALEESLKARQQDWQAVADTLPQNVRDFAENLRQQLSQTIRQLIEMEDHAHRRLDALRAGAREGLDSIQRKARVNKAYTAYGVKTSTPKYIDEKTDNG